MKIANFNIGTKLYASFIAVIAVFTFMAGFQIIQMGTMKDIEDQSVLRAQAMENTMQAKELSLQLYISAANGSLTRDVQKISGDFDVLKPKIRAIQKSILQGAVTEEDRLLVKTVNADFDKVLLLYSGTLLAELRKGKGADGAVINGYLNEIDKVSGGIDNNLTKLDEAMEKAAKVSMETFDRTYLSVVRIAVIIIAAGIIAALALAFIITRYIKGQLNNVMRVSKNLADGDLTERIRINSMDEFGRLGGSLNDSINTLENLITNIIMASQNLAQAVEQIAGGNQNLSQRTSEQASSLEEIASTIEEAAATINQNAENAARARDLTEAGVAISVDGNKIAAEAVQSIIDMNNSSKKVADITVVINEIAFQTNLLALNAAVEAARAGEQGRGFAVVAGEVRNLAQRSGNAAKEIEILIKDAIDKVEKSTDLVKKTGSALNEIAEAAKTSAQIINEIAAAGIEQKQGMNQINNAISEMDSTTQQNASLVEETASASEEMANQAQELLGMVEKFKISEDLKGVDHVRHGKGLHLKAARTGSAASKSSGGGNGKMKKVAPEKNEAIQDILRDEGFEEF